MLDRNKTDLTHAVTDAVDEWLDENGFKPIEREVPVKPGWCADLAGVIDPTDTELIRLKLIPRKPSWKLYQTVQWSEWQAQRDAASHLMTCLVEVKTTRGDFFGDKKWNVRTPADLAFLAVPKGLMVEAEWPTGWGVLEFNTEKHNVRYRRPPQIQPCSVTDQRDAIFAIATKCDHRTRYAELRDRQKEYRLHQRSVTIARHTRDLLSAIKALNSGRYGSFDETLLSFNLQKLPEHIKEELRTFSLPA